jgi:glycosyltransferase involved in cell wall biosynthesis
VNVSIIITTRNRAADLAQTLQAVRSVVVPNGLEAELLVVDNGSTDETAQVVKACQLPNIPVRYSYESRTGQSWARNRGLAETTGELILFIDDDVRPSPGWLAGMCEPMTQNGPCAVAGGVKLAPGLLRPWMTHLHRIWLASTEWLNAPTPQSMVGANMAFSREVLRRVPAFDPELGPGALGFGDEDLFARQLLEAGYRICARLDTFVEHHFDPRRLRRDSWLDAAARRGQVEAYVTYHWRHYGNRLARLRLLRVNGQLMAWRTRHAKDLPDEGCPERELGLVYYRGFLRGHLQERLRPRNYERHGLVKRSPDLSRKDVDLACCVQ